MVESSQRAYIITDRPAHTPKGETEVTPEMIEAGCSVLVDYDPDYSPMDAIVFRIFEAMRKAQRE